MKTLKHFFALALASVLAAATLSACNTVEGMGQDLKSAGKAIEETAERNK